MRKYLEDNDRLRPGQVLVLTSRRFIGNAIRDALIDRALNAMSYFAEDPVQPAAAAQGMCVLTLLVNREDRAALRAWLAMGSSSGLAGGYARLRTAAIENGESPSEVVRRLASNEIRLPHTQAIVGRWLELQDRLRDLEGKTGLELVRSMWPPDAEECDEIRLMAERIALTTAEPRLILEELWQEVTQPYLPDSESDVIRVMSLHKSNRLLKKAHERMDFGQRDA